MQFGLTQPQFKFVNAKSPHPAFVGGLGSGKTEALCWRAMTLKFKCPSQDIAYYLPTYDLIKRIAMPRICGLLETINIKYNLNKQDKVINIAGCSTIIFRSLDTPERIIGYEVGDSLVDELDVLPSIKAQECWSKIVARNRQKKENGLRNTIGVGTTPEGFKFTYEKWKKNPSEGRELITASTYSNEANLPENYIDDLKASFNDAALQAYLMGEFVNLTHGSVYPEFDRYKNSTFVEHDGKEPLHIGMDFNVNKMAASISVHHGGNPHVVDELVDYRDTPDLIEAIKQKYWPNGRNCSIFIYPDASGGARKSVNASSSDIALLRQAGFTVLAKSTNPFVRDRVAAVNKMILSGEDRRLKVNIDKCPHLVESLEKQAYDKNAQPDKSDGLDHVIDALGYYIAYTFPIAYNMGIKTKLKGL